VRAAWRAALALSAWLPVGCGGGGDSGSDPGGGQPDDAGAPGASPPLVINELMAKNRFTLPAQAGEPPDWIELYNPTAGEVALAGWWLTDDPGEPARGPLARALVVPAGGYLVLLADDRSDLGPAHLGFRLARAGGELALVGPDGAVVDHIGYGAQTTDLSAARTPDGSDRWQIVWQVSPGAANPDGDGAPDATSAREEVPAAGDVSDELLAGDAVREIGLELSEQAIASLREAPRVNVPAALVYRGRRFAPVGVHLKGQNSFQPIDEKPSFRIELDTYVAGGELLGLDDLTLDNMTSDPTMLHERMAYRAARLAGVPASRAGYAFVTVNGEPYGLYADVEHVEARMLARWYTDPGGPLYEASDVDFTAELVPRYEHESGPDDRTALYRLADALTLPAADALAAAAASVDMDEFIRHWAVMAVVGQFDAFPFTYDDYFVYQDPTSGRLGFLPWGMDESFSRLDYWVLAGESLLPDACQDHEPCRLRVVDEIWRVLALTEEADLVAELDRARALIAPWIARDPRRPWSDGEVAAAQDAMRAFLAGRRAYLEGEIPPPSAR
jgi:hypothetical protein